MASKVAYPWLGATVSIPLSIQNGQVAPSNGQLDPVHIAVAGLLIRVHGSQYLKPSQMRLVKIQDTTGIP